MEPENPNGVLDYTVSVVGVSLTTDAIVLNDTLVTVNTSESIDIQPHSNYTVVVTSGTGAGEGTPVSINFQTPEESKSAMSIIQMICMLHCCYNNISKAKGSKELCICIYKPFA